MNRLMRRFRVPRAFVHYWLVGTALLSCAYFMWATYVHRDSAIIGLFGGLMMMELDSHVWDKNDDWMLEWDKVQTAGFWILLASTVITVIAMALRKLT